MIRRYIIDFEVNYLVQDTFLVQKVELLQTKNNQDYLKFHLKDKTGEISAFLWSNQTKQPFTDYIRDIPENSVVEVKGKVAEYNTILILHLTDIRKTDDFDFSELVKAIDTTLIFNEVKNYLVKIQDNNLCSLRDVFLSDSAFISSLLLAPAAKMRHGAYQGGLIEHILDIMRFINCSMALVRETGNMDLLIMGAFIHDIGKIKTYDLTTCEYTREGRLIGHLVLGFSLLQLYIEKVDNFNLDLKDQLNHLLLSHHGSFEKGSVVRPLTLEANILSSLDELVANLRDVKECVDVIKVDESPKFNKLLDRYLYNFRVKNNTRKIRLRKK